MFVDNLIYFISIALFKPSQDGAGLVYTVPVSFGMVGLNIGRAPTRPYLAVPFNNNDRDRRGGSVRCQSLTLSNCRPSPARCRCVSPLPLSRDCRGGSVLCQTLTQPNCRPSQARGRCVIEFWNEWG